MLIAFIGNSCTDVYEILDTAKPRREKVKTLEYAGNGFRIMHPEGWSVESSPADSDGFSFVSIGDTYSPQVLISVAPAEREYELDESADNSFREMKDVSNLRIASVSTDIAGRNRTGIRHRFVVSVWGVDIPYTADYFVIELGNRSAFVRVQAADEDWPAAESEFKIILDEIEFSASGA
ncbi:MAG: hypothetical protein OEM82_00595 [Acidobacteriota bacterium]|nr:hypothetical protein [Acidobacteriota bacterium]